MEALQDGVVAFFAAVGITAVVWIAAGALFRFGRTQIPGLLLVLPLRGEAPAMEHDVRELRRLRHSLPGAEIVLVDCGLTEDAEKMAEYFAFREEGVRIRTAEEFRVR